MWVRTIPLGVWVIETPYDDNPSTQRVSSHKHDLETGVKIVKFHYMSYIGTIYIDLWYTYYVG